MEPTVLGLPLNIDLGNASYSVTPKDALVIMRGTDSAGDEVYAVALTPGLSMIDGLAFADFAKLHCEFDLRKTFYALTE
jgi:hypothetical protein